MAKRMKPPAHPGRVLLQEFMEPYDLSARKLGQMLGVAHNGISNIISGKGRITPNIATRLEQLFGMSAEAWLKMQFSYDLAIEKLTADATEMKAIHSHRKNLKAA